MNKINFFWKGENFDGWTYLCIKSHIKVGHTVIIWLSGKEPLNKWWKLIKNDIIIKNADDIININYILNLGGNFQTASALWRFTFLYEHGGWYCDTDAYALKKFPITENWIVSSAEVDRLILSIGVIHAPKNNTIFKKCMDNIKIKWGNVKVFDKFFKERYGTWTPSINSYEYYPWTWKEWDNLYKDIKLEDLIKKNVKSIHLYHTMLKRNNKHFSFYKNDCLLNRMIKYAESNKIL
jgi:hypothetical protein